MGSMLGCRSASLAIAAGMSIGKSPFTRIDSFGGKKYDDTDEKDYEHQMKNESILQERKKIFASVGNSDLALFAAVYLKWDSIQNGGGEKKKFCESLGLLVNSMKDMKQMVKQLE